MSLAILFHFLCVQHVSDINISIVRSLWLFCWIITLVVLFLVRCVLEFRFGWFGVISVLQVEAFNTDITPNQPHRNSNTHRTKNNTTNVIIQQISRKLLTMDILMSETCWAHKKWNKIASDMKLVFYSSTITMMHGPINMRSILESNPYCILQFTSSNKYPSSSQVCCNFLLSVAILIRCPQPDNTITTHCFSARTYLLHGAEYFLRS